MRKNIKEIMNRLARFPIILATLVVGCAFVFAGGANAAGGDKQVGIEITEKVEKIVNIEQAKKVDSKAFVNENGVVVSEVDFNPFFRPFDDFFIVNDIEKFEGN